MEPENSAIDHTGVESAAAAAASVLVALPQAAAAAAADAGQSKHCLQRKYFEVLQEPTLFDAQVVCVCYFVGNFLVKAGRGPRLDSAGKQICELCPVRLSRAKGKLYKHEPGMICHACYNGVRRAAVVAAPAEPVAASKPSRKKRAASDPGESPEPATLPALTRRVTPPKPSSTSKKQYNTRREEQIMRLLDETHARRMERDAAEAAATAATSGSLAHQ